MSKVIYFNMPYLGHINPSLPIVEELIKRGETVIYYCTDTFKDKITSTGAIYRSYGPDFYLDENFVTKNVTEILKIHLDLSLLVLDKIINELREEKPDYIIHDSMCTWGKYAGQILGIPVINTIATLAYTKDSMSSSNNFIKDTLLMLLGNIPNIMKVMSLSGRLKKRHGLKKIDLMDVFISQENLNIVYTTKELQPNSQSFDDSFKFVGPTAVNRRSRETNFPFDRLDGKYVIYISLGTVFNNDVDFYYKCFEALKDMDICAVLSVGSNVDTGALKNIPANFIVMNYINIPQLEILKRCNLFITHGGMNSIHEGIYYELPLISIPQQLDQQLISEQVQKYGNGIYLKPSNVTAQSIRDSVRTIMEDESYKKNTIKIKESFISSGGYMRAADEILSFAGKKSGVKIS